MLRGVKKLDFKFIFTMAAYDLIKLPKLIGAARLSERQITKSRNPGKTFQSKQSRSHQKQRTPPFKSTFSAPC
jgi:hypothetical protein